MKPYIVTLSGPNMVRIEMHVDGKCLAWTEGTVEQAEDTAAAILDSARLARKKAKEVQWLIPARAGIPE